MVHRLNYRQIILGNAFESLKSFWTSCVNIIAVFFIQENKQDWYYTDIVAIVILIWFQSLISCPVHVTTPKRLRNCHLSEKGIVLFFTLWEFAWCHSIDCLSVSGPCQSRHKGEKIILLLRQSACVSQRPDCRWCCYESVTRFSAILTTFILLIRKHHECLQKERDANDNGS